MDLNARIQELSINFANQIRDAIMEASMFEILDLLNKSQTQPVVRPSAPRQPRAQEDVQKVLERVLRALADQAEGLRSEQLQKALGLGKQDLAKALKEGLNSGAVVKTGNRRSTTYKVPVTMKKQKDGTNAYTVNLAEGAAVTNAIKRVTRDHKDLMEALAKGPEEKVEHEIKADQMPVEAIEPKGVKRKHPFVKKRKKQAA